MYSASFIFQPGEYDDEFHRLNDEIDAVADSFDSFKGVEKWTSTDGKKFNAIYYWDNLDDLKAFARHPSHIEAKRQYKKWYDGFHIIVSEIIKSYGDEGLGEHITPNERART